MNLVMYLIHVVIAIACGVGAERSLDQGDWETLSWQLISFGLATWRLWTAKRIERYELTLRRRLRDEIWDAAAARGNKITDETRAAYLACYRIVAGTGSQPPDEGGQSR